MKSKHSSSSNLMNDSSNSTSIAVIGLDCIFPQSGNLEAYWNNIISKADCITDVPASRWAIDDYYDADPKAPDKTYCKRGGFIPEIDFNPIEFGLPPNILEVTDVTQTLSLIVAKQAMLDAGYAEANEAIRQRTGVILGVGGGQKLITPLTTRLQYPVWEKVLRSSGLSEQDTQHIIEKMKLAYVGWEENAFPGLLGNVIAGRIANRLDLGGINCVVDAACASSMGALRMALSELTEKRADLMITGGVDLDNSIFMYMCFSKTPAFSQQEHMKPFDAESDGMMVGEGIGMMVLKRLEDAERDNDRIYAVIQGMGSSSDGKYKSIYAPRATGQAIALQRAYEDAGFSPETVGLIEAHGTGTAAGDPTEFSALNEVFSQHCDRKQAIALGSVKSQIGHTKAAAGAASLIKAILALHHKVLPATLHINQPNPKLNIQDSPFYLNTETRAWIRPESSLPRRAGVSSFGFGGTNYHVVLEEYGIDQLQAYRLHPTPGSILLIGVTPSELVTRCETVLSQLQSEEGEWHYQTLLKASRSLEVPTTLARVGFVVASLSEACERLQTTIELLKRQPASDHWEHPKGIYYRKTGMNAQGKVVALFPGQGSQYVEMGRELLLNFPPMRQSYAFMDSLFVKDNQTAVSEVVFPRPSLDPVEKKTQEATLRQTEFAQPAIGMFSAGLFKILEQAGFKPDFVAGHSFGELTALWAAGVLNDEDYCFLVKSRGQALSAPSHPDFDAGAMLAVTGEIDRLEMEIQAFSNVTIANWNSKTQVVLAGTTPEVIKVQQHLDQRGYKTVQLPVSAAFHTPLVSHAYQTFSRALRVVLLNQPKVPVFSNVTGVVYPENATAISQNLSSQLLNPVRFKQEIENIYAAGGTIFVEIGPRSVLTHLVSNILEGKPHLAIALNGSRSSDSDRQLRDAVMQLRVAGLSLNNFDPYALEKPVVNPSAKKGLTVRLNGSNYVSEQTKAAFEQALQDGYHVSFPNHPVQEVVSVVELSQTIEMPVAIATPKLIEAMLAVVSDKTGYPAEMLELSMDMEADLGIDSIKRVEILGAMQEQFTDLPPIRTEELAELRTLEQIVQHLTEQSPLKETKSQVQNFESCSPDFVQLAPEWNSGRDSAEDEMPKTSPTATDAQSEPSNSTDTSASPTLQPDLSHLVEAMLTVVSDKTGYPVAMLELSMDMEADLGIDSIKRVEILGAMQEQFTDLPPIRTEELAELRTLEQIAQYLGQQRSITVQPAPIAVPTIAQPMPEEIATPSPKLSQYVEAMLAIVSDKTGYPTEMLELGMDMEADLGIDSIKRVEILGAMQEQFSDLPSIRTEELAELRTLEQIVQHLDNQPISKKKESLLVSHSLS